MADHSFDQIFGNPEDLYAQMQAVSNRLPPGNVWVEDAIGQAFLQAHLVYKRGKLPAHPRAWLLTVAINAACRLSSRRLHSLTDAAPEPQVQPDNVFDIEHDFAVLLNEVRNSLKGFGGYVAEVVEYVLLGNGRPKAADRFGIPLARVHHCMARALPRLRERLKSRG
jgi:DNA-directed RNA polymerase specialized sigma24 family protein